MHIYKLMTLCLLCGITTTNLTAQAEEKKTKVVIIEKEVGNDGNMTEKKIILEGEKAKAYLEENEEVSKWITDEGEEIELDGKKGKMIKKRAFKLKVINDEGEEELIEWDGEGEMPADLKEMLEKEGIDPFMMGVEEGDGTEEISETITYDDTGKKKVMMIKKEGDGLEEVMDFDWEGDELPAEIREVLEQEGIELEEIMGPDGQKEIKIIKAPKAANQSAGDKPRLGVMIGGGEGGVHVAEVVANSAAAEGGIQAGDIITAINDKSTTVPDQLIWEITTHKPGDVVKLSLIRDGRPLTKEVTLKAYVDPFPFKTWEQVMNHGKEKNIEIDVEEKVIIKKAKK